MPPEQLLGRDVDHRADLFAVGVMLVEALTGGKALDGAGPPGAGERAPQPVVLSAELDDLLRSCLAADPRDRPASAVVLKQRLVPLLQPGLPPTAGRRDS
jgi:serine/threonine-protein kinase